MTARRVTAVLAGAFLAGPCLVVVGRAGWASGLAPVYLPKLHLAGLLALPLGAVAIVGGVRRQPIPRFVLWPTAAFVVLQLVAAAVSPLPSVALPTAAARAAIVVAALALCTSDLLSLGELRVVTAIVAVVLAVAALAQTAGVALPWPTESAPAATLVHRNNVAFHLAATLPLLLAPASSPRARRWLFAAVIVITAGLVATRSRGGWAAAGCALALVLPTVATARRGRLALAVAAALAVVALLPSRGVEPLTARLHVAGSSDAVRDRLSIYRTAVAEVAARPLTGWGPAVFGVTHPAFLDGWVAADHPHDDVLTAAHEAGIPAALALAWILVAAPIALLRQARARGDAELGALAASLVAWAVLGIGNSPLALAPSMVQFWLTLAVAVRTSTASEEKRS